MAMLNVDQEVQFTIGAPLPLPLRGSRLLNMRLDRTHHKPYYTLYSRIQNSIILLGVSLGQSVKVDVNFDVFLYNSERLLTVPTL